jgi:PAS domain S-box-containing protein
VIIGPSMIKNGNTKLAEQLIISAEPTVVIRQDTSLELINHSFEELTGFLSKGLLGSKAPYPWWTEETLIKNSNTLAKIIDGDTGVYFELYQKKNGEQFCAEVDSQIMALDNETEKHYLIRLVDIVKFTGTDKIHIGLELYTHKLIQNASYPILVTNPDGSIKCVNYALEEMTGYRAHELVGKKLPYPWCTSDEKSTDYDILNINAQTRRRGVWRIEKLLHNKFGKLYWIEVTGIPVLRSGKVQYYVCNWRDITEQKILEQKIIGRSDNLGNHSAHIDYILKKERGKISREPYNETLSVNESNIQKQTHENLSPREFQIMCMIARGTRLKDIAEELYLSVKTISTYRANILTKMNYTTNAELTHYAISNKLVKW